MAQFPVVKGIAARFTKINSCGRPIAGAANRLVTKGFVSVKLTPEMKNADDLEQVNAEGRVCVADRTPPVRKYFNVEAEFCNVDSELIGMLTSWEQVLDYADKSIGFRDQADVESDYGVALEVWTGGRSDDDCPAPADDSVFSQSGSGRQYGYLLLGATEFSLGDISVSAAISTFTLTGISVAIPQWGRGPYNVAGTDAAGTPGRLLVPASAKEHFTLFRTPVAPPEPTGGAKALKIADVFDGTPGGGYYYGGPASEPAADVAPEQDTSSYTVTIAGATGGTFTLTVGGQTTTGLAFDAATSAVKSALEALSSVGSGKATVSGSAGGPYTVTLAGGGVLTGSGTGLTGSGTPSLTIAAA